MNLSGILQAAVVSGLVMALGSAPAWAQGDPGEVPDLAVHQGPNTATHPDDSTLVTALRFSGTLLAFSGGTARGVLSWEAPSARRGEPTHFLYQFQTADVECDSTGGVSRIHFTGLLTEMGRGGTSSRITFGSVEPTDIPDCLIWDIVDGNVHDTTGARIQFIGEGPCPL